MHNESLNGVIMAKSIPNKSNPGAFALEFVGSIIYLALVYLTSSGLTAVGSFSTAVIGVWLPLLYAAGVLSAVSLFLLSFTNLIKGNPMGKAGMAPVAIGAFSFIAMTAGNFGLVAVAVIGFVLGAAGAAYAKASCNMRA